MAGQAPALDESVRAGLPSARAAVLGSPISHSLSPVLHTAGYAELGLSEWDYRAIECTQEQFPAWFAALGPQRPPSPQWRGLSLTMPLKRVVIPLLAEVNPLAATVGAVNTVIWDGDGRSVGENTDVHGIVQALRSAGVEKAGSACILGAGATACSAVAALAELGCDDLVLQVRSPQRARAAITVAGQLGFRVAVTGLDEVRRALAAEVVVATLPGPAAADWAGRLDVAAGDRPAGVLLDVGYHPWPTSAAAFWSAAGGVAVGGFEMLLHQAAAQFTLMTGLPAPLNAMRAAGEKALAA